MGWFRRKSKKTKPAGRFAVVKASYDAAQTTTDNANHWAHADALSPDAANSVAVRQTLRKRARYEIANNSYAKGIVLTLANDCVGTGPRLQVLTDDAELNRRVETAFSRWAHQIDLAAKLRTMCMAKAGDGEIFAVLTDNDVLAGPVKLDLKLIEADRVANPFFELASNQLIDGIELDGYGNPARYIVWRNHPGDTHTAGIDDFDVVDANSVIHWFRPDRPGQHRGVPEITAALPLFAQLRRYTLAVIAAAETAANFAMALEAAAPADGDADPLDPMDVVELERCMATVLPMGWKLTQTRAEQPTTTYGEFKREILNEIARCLNIPLNIALCNSAGYNYASGRLDHQTYYKSIFVEQAHLATVVLDRLLAAWIREAMLSTELAGLRLMSDIPHQWFFDGTEHVDPAKEANAEATKLQSNTINLAEVYGRRGKDWEVELRQRAKERQLMVELGLAEEPTVSVSDTEQDDEEEK